MLTNPERLHRVRRDGDPQAHGRQSRRDRAFVSFVPASGSESRRSPSLRRTTAARSMPDRHAHGRDRFVPRRERPGARSDRSRGGCHPSRLRVPRRECRLRRGSVAPAASGSARLPRRFASAGTSSRRSASPAKRACRRCPRERRPRSAFRSSSRRPRAAAGGDAHRARAGDLDEALAALGARPRRHSATTRSSASATSSGRGTSRRSCSDTQAASAFSASATARSSAATRSSSRSPRPRAAIPGLAADRGCGGRVRDGDRVRSAGTAEFLVDGDEMSLPRAERPDPGRASGHRGGDRSRPRRAPAPGRRRRAIDLDGAPAVTPSRPGSTRRIRGRSCPRPDGSTGSSSPRDIRVDAGVEEGDEIGTGLRPPAREADRPRLDARGALERLDAALAETWSRA